MNQEFYTYMVRCSDGSYYVGWTNNLVKRVRQHNGEIKGGAWYTSWKKPVELVFSEQHETKSLALKREHALKKLTHEQKQLLINRTHSKLES